MTNDIKKGLNQAAFQADYTIKLPLGRGAYGKVYLARQHSLNRLVAIKFFDPRRDESPDEDAARFVRETRLLGRLSHPHILRVFDANLLDEKPFLVTEYLDGSDLSHSLKPGKPLETGEAIRICLAVASALEYLHGEQILHRDLKPDNVLLGVDGSVKVSDFGLARPFETDQGITLDGTIVGTPAFLAPETLISNKVGAAGDVYAFGVILFMCFDGTFPFDLSVPREEFLARRTEEDARPPGAHVPRPLASLISACVSREPRTRPTAAEVRKFFTDMRGGQESDTGSSIVQAAGRGARPWPPAGFLDRQPPPALSPPITADAARPPRPGTAARTRDQDSRWIVLATVMWLFAIVAAALLFLRQAPGGRSGPVAPVDAPAGEASAVPPLPEPVPGQSQAAPAGRAGSGRAPLDSAKLLLLPAALRTGCVTVPAGPGPVSARETRECLERCGAGRVVRQLLATGGELPAGSMPAAGLPDLLEALQALRLAACRLRAAGSEALPEYEQLAFRVFPLLRGEPPGTAPVMWIIHNQPVTVPTEAESSLGLTGEGWTMKQLPGLQTDWQRRGPRRVWWMVQVRDLGLGQVLNLHVATGGKPVHFALTAANRPSSDPEALYRGILAIGFDSRLLDRSTGKILFSYSWLHKKTRAVPVLEKLGLFE